MNRRTMLIGGAAALTTTAAAASLVVRRALPPALTFQTGGVAIGGTDPVTYWTHARPIGGDPLHTHVWADATWRFITAQNRDDFAANPKAFAPQYGGFCAWAVAAKGQLFSTQPDKWAIVDGRLFLNFDESVQTLWDENRRSFINRADLRWPRIIAAV